MKLNKKLAKLALMTALSTPILFGCVDTSIDADYENTLENGGAYHSEVIDDEQIEQPESEAVTSEVKIISLFEIEGEGPGISDTLKVIEKEAHNLGGYVNSHTLSPKSKNKEDKVNAEVNYRVPKKNAKALIRVINERVNVTLENSHSIDVSEEILDIQANIEGLSIQEERLNKLIEDASSTDEALKVDEKLSKINKEKKALESKEKSINEKSNYSRINLTLHEVPEDPTKLLSSESMTIMGLLGILGISLFIKMKSDNGKLNIKI